CKRAGRCARTASTYTVSLTFPRLRYGFCSRNAGAYAAFSTSGGRSICMSLEATSDLWWKNAIIYCVDVQSFLDTSADGVGDLDGLTQRIDYLAGIGVTCLWLMPIYPSPGRDFGYDVADYYGIAEQYGTLGDLVELVRTARERGIRVIMDLVINHTSVDHPWFQAARRDRKSTYHDFYVWAV